MRRFKSYVGLSDRQGSMLVLVPKPNFEPDTAFTPGKKKKNGSEPEM